MNPNPRYNGNPGRGVVRQGVYYIREFEAPTDQIEVVRQVFRELKESAMFITSVGKTGLIDILHKLKQYFPDGSISEPTSIPDARLFPNIETLSIALSQDYLPNPDTNLISRVSVRSGAKTEGLDILLYEKWELIRIL